MARKPPDVGVIIPAGGTGTRFGSRLPKQFLTLGSVPILVHSVRAFERIKSVGEIVLVVPEDLVKKTMNLARRYKLKKVSNVVPGGRERQLSVRNGLLAFAQQPEIVLVHDAVRPLVTRKIIEDVISDAYAHGAAVVGVPVKDTIKIGSEGFYEMTLDRNRLWAVQTPQGFRYEILYRAHLAALRSAYIGTDEASLIERLRLPVKIVMGDYKNIKITTLEDLKTAKALRND